MNDGRQDSMHMCGAQRYARVTKIIKDRMEMHNGMKRRIRTKRHRATTKRYLLYMELNKIGNIFSLNEK